MSDIAACKEKEDQKRNKNIRESPRWNKCYISTSNSQRPRGKYYSICISYVCLMFCYSLVGSVSIKRDEMSIWI